MSALRGAIGVCHCKFSSLSCSCKCWSGEAHRGSGRAECVTIFQGAKGPRVFCGLNTDLLLLEDNLRRPTYRNSRNRVRQSFCGVPISTSRPAKGSLLLHLSRSHSRLDGFLSACHSIPMQTTEPVDIYAIKLPFKGLLTVRSDDTQHDH